MAGALLRTRKRADQGESIVVIRSEVTMMTLNLKAIFSSLMMNYSHNFVKNSTCNKPNQCS